MIQMAEDEHKAVTKLHEDTPSMDLVQGSPSLTD
jgi:hypothetical protein